MTSLSDRLLRHAQALEYQVLYAQSRRATAKRLREAAKELNK